MKPVRAARARPRRGALLGVEDHTPERPPLDWDIAIRRYRDEGWTITEIARLAGYAVYSVRVGFRKRGVKMHTRRTESVTTWRLRYIWRSVLTRARRDTPGGRRIALCRAWRRFPAFCEFARTAGYRKGLSLVRLDPEKGFMPSNVRFVKRSEVAQYTRWARKPRHLVTAFGETKGFMEWLRDPRCRVGLPALSGRLRDGVDPEVALTTARFRKGEGRSRRARRRAASAPKRIDVARAARLYAKGLDFSEIGRRIGAGRTGVRDALRRHGVVFRPRSKLTVTREGVLLSKLWSSLRARCNNPTDHLYPFHGAKGIRVGRQWRLFADFHDWALASGWKPGLCLLRTDARKGYNPANCRFVTQSELSLATKRPSRTRGPYVLVTAFGETKGMTAWSVDPRCVVSEITFARRLRDGMHPEDALSIPTGRPRHGAARRLLTAFGETKSLARWVRDHRCKVTSAGLRNRLRQGMDPQAAISTPPWKTSVRRGG